MEEGSILIHEKVKEEIVCTFSIKMCACVMVIFYADIFVIDFSSSCIEIK